MNHSHTAVHLQSQGEVIATVRNQGVQLVDYLETFGSCWENQVVVSGIWYVPELVGVRVTCLASDDFISVTVINKELVTLLDGQCGHYTV